MKLNIYICLSKINVYMYDTPQFIKLKLLNTVINQGMIICEMNYIYFKNDDGGREFAKAMLVFHFYQLLNHQLR